MKSKLQVVEASRRRLDARQAQLEKLRQDVIKQTIGAIFEVLGIPVVVSRGYLNHHAKGVTVTYSEGRFEVKTNAGKLQVRAYVKDETDSVLAQFKQAMEAKPM